MRWQTYLLVSLVLILLSAPVMAEIPDTGKTTFTSVKDWVVANNADSTVLTLTVKNSAGIGIDGLGVQFSVNESVLGSLSQVSTSTNSTGIATTTFRAKTKSGTANVTATITYTEGNITKTMAKSKIILIDHDTPYAMQWLQFPNTATVGSIQEIKVRMQDIHGNFVDNRKDPEYITFTIITDDESRFWNSTEMNFTNTKVTLGNNEEGWVIPKLSIATQPGDTYILIKPLNLVIADRTIKIERVADGEPWYIYAVRRDPSVPHVPANGKDSFVITYQLFDQYWNVLNNKLIDLSVEWVAGDSAPSWHPNMTTTFQGLAAERYGPFEVNRTFKANLIATARDNSSVQSILPVEFYDPSPVDLLISINPRNMPSLDVNTTSRAVITALVIDKKGKGVEGQTVYFSNESVVYTPPNANVVQEPWLSKTSAVTGPSGFAYADFIPGGFATNEYRPVTGTMNVTGSWDTKMKTVTPIWKNYGYLKVTTWVENTTLSKGEEVRVGVEVYADGPSYTARPIDMIFCVHRGASMLLDTYIADGSADVHDKMVYVFEHTNVLIDELTQCPPEEECDRAGVVSFGPGLMSTNWPDKDPGRDKTKDDDANYTNQWYPAPHIGYEDFSTIDAGLTYTFDPLVNDTIRSLRPYGDPWKGWESNVPLRYGLYRAINEMIGLEGTPQRPDAIRAIVLLTDIEWNDWGDPTAGWDGTSVKTSQAETKKSPWELPEGGLSAWVPFYSFGRMVNGNMTVDTNVAISDPRQNMVNYAKDHNIIIYPIAYPEKDNNIDTAHERVLRYIADSTGGQYFEARSGTELRTIFEQIGKDLRQRASINTTAVFNFTNVKIDGTLDVPGIEAFDYVYQEGESTKIQKWTGTDHLVEHRNDTVNWTNNQKLVFDLGTMYSGDRWVTNFTLRANMTGTVELFEDSYVYSDDDTIVVPQPIIQTGGITFGDVPTSDLNIDWFTVDSSMNAAYSISYTGEETVHTRLYYRKATDSAGNPVTGSWKQFAARNYRLNSIQDDAVVNKWMLGSGTYYFMLEAWAKDAPRDAEISGPLGIQGKFFIWLK